MSDQICNEHGRGMSWPAAATLIAALAGAAATTIALAMTPERDEVPIHDQHYATAREIGDVKARLGSLEQSTYQMRLELRGDIKELRELIQQLLNKD